MHTYVRFDKSSDFTWMDISLEKNTSNECNWNFGLKMFSFINFFFGTNEVRTI